MISRPLPQSPRDPAGAHSSNRSRYHDEAGWSEQQRRTRRFDFEPFVHLGESRIAAHLVVES